MAKKVEDKREDEASADEADRVGDNPAESAAILGEGDFVHRDDRPVATNVIGRKQDDPANLAGFGDLTSDQVAAQNRARLARGEKIVVPDGLDDKRNVAKSQMEIEAEQAGMNNPEEVGAGGDLSEAPLSVREDARDESRHE